ncbi:hypothetical protein Emed_001235 [Eimeria media]
MAWAHQGVGVAAAAVCTPDGRRANQVAFHRSCCRPALPSEGVSRAVSMASPASPSRVASLADSMLTEEAQAVSEELVRAARNWQEEHREWQKRYSQWLAEQSHWDYARHAAACAAAEGGRSLSTSMRQSTCSASGVLSGAMRRALFAGRRATTSVCSRAANRTRRGLVPAARRLGRRLKAALARSNPELEQQQQQLQQQQQHDEYLLHVRQQRLLKEQLLQQQQCSLMELELLQQQQQQHQQQQLRRQQQRHLLAATQQVQQLQPQQQHAQQHQQQHEEGEEDDDDEFEEWSQREEEEELQEERVASESLEASPENISKSNLASKKKEGEGLTSLEENNEEDDWVDEDQVLQGLNSSINWIVDVGLNPAARAAAAAALQRREKLQQLQQQQQQKQSKRFDAEPSRASSAATCCDSVGTSEEGATVHGQISDKPLVQTPRAAVVVRCRQKLRFQGVEGGGRTPQREESECSLEDCVLHSHQDDTHEAFSDTDSCNSCSNSSSSSVSSAYLERRLRASRRLREAAAAAKKRQLALAQRRAEAAKREELCYNEVCLDSAL